MPTNSSKRNSNKTTYHKPSSNKTNISKGKKKLVKKRKVRTWFFLLLLLISFSMLSFSLYHLITWHQDNQKIKQINEDIKDDISLTKKDEQGDLVNPIDDTESDYWYYVKMPFYEVDFNKLLQKNSDTVAFIHMNNTNINYPVVQTNDNSYYLTHAYDKSNNDAGWVFMDYRNDINSFNDNMIIYGHGRLDTTVFGSLKNSLTSKWQQNKDNYVIWLSTPQENMLFQIFSIYTIDSENYYITTNFNSTESKQKWINTMKTRNTAPIDTIVTRDDYILTLSTCQNNDGGRIVVQAKLIKKQTRS